MVKSPTILTSRNKDEDLLFWVPPLQTKRCLRYHSLCVPTSGGPGGGGDSGASWCQYLAPSSELVPFIIRKAKYHLPSVLVLALPTTPSILFSLSQKSHHSYPYRPSLPNIGDGMRKCVAIP